jgi:Glycosyltransferase family 87
MLKHLKNKWLYYLGGLVILVAILFEVRGSGDDFNIFLSASRDLMLGKNIYQVPYNEWYHYYYDLLFALALTPFTFLPIYVVKLMWLILNVFFVYRIWKIITAWLPLTRLKKNSKTLFIILSFVFILGLLHDNFHLIQVTIFILYLALEGLFLINNNKLIAGSILITLGINIKLLPIVLIPYLLYRKEWKASLYIVGFIILFLCLPIVFIGFDYTKFLLIERWHLINPMNQAHILDTSERSFHSLTTLLATLLVKDCGDWHALPLKRNIADISIANLNIVINIVRAALILFTVYFLRTKPFRNITSKLQKLYEISYLCLLIPLIFPHQQFYAFFFIFPASTYLLYYLVYLYFNNENNDIGKHLKTRKIALIVSISIAYFATNCHFILGAFHNYYDHYKILTYGVILLMILLAVCKPGKILEKEQKII